ncbi:MAG: xanthine dehydrogenase family protein molybdopterin-binding subunit [Bacillota bacterium]
MVVGSSIPRTDLELLTSGKALFIDDINLPGMTYGAVLRSAVAHARILRLDISRALRMPGVVAGVTAADFRDNRYGPTHKDQPVLADCKVRHVGEGLAAIAAETPELAEEALSKIQVELEELPPVLDPVEAMEPGSPKVHDGGNVAYTTTLEKGNVQAGFQISEIIVEDSFRTQMVEHCHLEPHGAVAQMLDDGSLRVWTSIQRPFIIANDIARVLGMPLNRVSVSVLRVGGGFGGKNEITVEPIAAALAIKCGRPVKVTFSRHDEMVASTVRHAYVIRIRTGLGKRGELLAREVNIVSDAGGYVSWGARTLDKACVCAAGPYEIPNIKVTGILVYTTKNVGGAMRGFGVPQVCFAHEVHTDHICRTIGVDPLEFRKENCVRTGSTTVTSQRLEVVTLPTVLDRLEEMIRSGGRPSEH